MRAIYTFFQTSSFLLLLLLLCQCKRESAQNKPPADALFTLLDPAQTGVSFRNNITEGLNTNVLMYEYFYNGGGVAVGDLNNDGLDDLYFTSNMESNQIYLNKGNLSFEDISATAGASGRPGPWKTGVTMADVNGDGWLDIHVCYSGSVSPENRSNQLFINQGANASGRPTFVDKAEEYGLNSPATSTQATFFDYDKDGDLDLFLLNHNPRSLPVLDEASTAEILKVDDPSNGMRLFRHDQSPEGEPRFKDITREAGLLSSALSYGLGAAMADFNGDGWTDMYISNDYTIPDFLYINNQRGGFVNQISRSMGHFSHFSMGSDAADVNNDGLPDILTLDMLPEDNRRQKLLMAPDNYEKFEFNLRVGFGHQYMRNMLQINQGLVNGELTFAEVGQLAGMASTDWSWAALFADYDNDGWKDLYITNGYLRDYTNLDFLKFMGDYVKNNQGNLQRENVLDLVQQIPASNLHNYLFWNSGQLKFDNVSQDWGIGQASNSNGAAYSDLDNDGDLDLVVNNINLPAFIYRNEADKKRKHHFLKVKLEGEGQNKYGLGARITLYQGGKKQSLEQMPTRGYQSSVSPVLHFGLGEQATIDSLEITWLSGKTERINQPQADQLLTLKEQNAQRQVVRASRPVPIFQEINSPIAFADPVSNLNDFKRQPLLTHPLSSIGPCLSQGDVNGDGLEDLYVGGTGDQAGALFIQMPNGQYKRTNTPALEADKASDDADALFFDANGDGFQDLYVCSGGYANFKPADPALQDRLYLNDGKGQLSKSPNALPKMLYSKSCVRAADVNGDGKLDLFVGGRVIPGRYPEIPRSYLLINQGKGQFKDQTATLAPALAQVGMVTDAAWQDLNGDKQPELIVVGEFMPIAVFTQQGGKWTEASRTYFDQPYAGLWNRLRVEDLNGDGKADLLLGNLGLNAQLRASMEEPAELYFKDFDDNGAIDPILCFYVQGKSYPYLTRDELLDQISLMRGRFPDYKSYADAGLKEVFTAEELKGVNRLEANYLKTALFLADSQGKFQEKPLPLEAQMAPVFALASLDFNGDGKKDLFLGGNINNARLKFGKYDANHGLILQGNGKGDFKAIPQSQAGLRLQGDVRSVLALPKQLIIGIHQQKIKAYQFYASKPF